jgi:putative FmdB family regulatory protein
VPTYQYACTACDERLEVVQKFTDDALTVCSECGGKLRKLYSAVGIVFKGSGFYRTDSRNGSGSNGSSGNGSGGNGSGGNGSGGNGSESSKPDAGTKDAAKKDAPAATGASGGDSKPAAKTEKAGSGSSPAGSKVA